MLKLLVIDYISPIGHENFNGIHINALLELGHSITAIGGKGQFDTVSRSNQFHTNEKNDVRIKYKYASSFLTRITNILFLFKIKKLYKLIDYDYIIFPTYDVLSLFFFRTKQKVILINHNNVSQLGNKIKLWLTRHLPLNYIHVTLSREMNEQINELNPCRISYYIPHGIIQPSGMYKKPSFVKGNDKYIFCPVNRNCDIKLITSILNSQHVNDYLRKSRIKVIIKNISEKLTTTETIIVANTHLEKSEYDYLIKNSLAVWIPYDNTFKYRCSGIMFESIAYNKPIIASDIQALKCFERDCNMTFATDEESFVCSIEMSLEKCNITFDVDKFNPTCYWNRILVK